MNKVKTKNSRERDTIKRRYILLSSDLISISSAVIGGWLLAEFIKNLFFADLLPMEWDRAKKIMPVLFGLPSVFIILGSGFQGHYNRFRPFWNEFAELFKIILFAAGMVIIYLYFVKSHFSRMWFFASWLLVIVMMPLGRLLAKKVMMQVGIWFNPTVVIGTGFNAVESALAVESDPLLGMKIVALIELEEESPNKSLLHRNSTMGSPYKIVKIGDPLETFHRLGDPYVVLALDPADYQTHAELINRLTSSQVNMSIVPPMRGLPLLCTEVFHIFRYEVLLLRYQNNLARRSLVFLKRSFDLILSSVLLVILLPLFAFFSWRIKRDGGKTFFRHRRIGCKGKPFKCYKFRTMSRDADRIFKETLASDKDAQKEWNRNFKLKIDPRITPIGQFLRKNSLDELPQLWNVLKGEMSLVGPRPIVEEELERYGDQAHYYLEVKPGMTGLWQISGRNDIDYQRRVYLDGWYVRNWSLWYDIVILMKSLPIAIRGKGAY